MNKSWDDVSDALDTFIASILYNMYTNPNGVQTLQKELDIAMAKKEEILLLARQEALTCQECNRTMTDEKRCDNCGDALCEECCHHLDESYGSEDPTILCFSAGQREELNDGE